MRSRDTHADQSKLLNVLPASDPMYCSIVEAFNLPCLAFSYENHWLQAVPPSALDEHAADAGIDPGTGKVGTSGDRLQAKLCCMCAVSPSPALVQ